MASSNVYVFGDQTISVLDKLQSLLHVKDNATLASFLHEAFIAIRRETEVQPSTDRESIVQSESLGLLLEGVRRGTTHAALESCFLSIYEIGYYLDYIAKCNEQHPPAGSSLFLGICTGGLAAAAISCAKSVFEISKLGVQAVIIAFRQGMHIHRRAEHLGFSAPASWSMIVASSQKERVLEALTKLSENKNLPIGLKAYISAVGPGFTTISGSPAVLKSLKSLNTLSSKRMYPAPIYGPYHCSSAYSEADLEQTIDMILKGIEFGDNESFVPLASCASGLYKTQSCFRALLEHVLESAFSEQIRMDRVADALFEHVSANDTTFIPINAQATTCNLIEWLSQRGATARIGRTLEDVTKDQKGTSSTHDDANKIAIVGYSGRFPEADNLDEFWDYSLEDSMSTNQSQRSVLPAITLIPPARKRTPAKFSTGAG
ncbi:hypothetical protein FSARC_12440 [Fusarium sarcochroum]|uniref:Starter acyltransferase (SAT) domain-containing protein n=1 Tax=Fusarium sarcochroum TaxID=1208366 RepID=A0A8H4T8J9_9HYPO|nr:hypothetical protein FSARC_12440 [Fusarium sarcochroum]